MGGNPASIVVGGGIALGSPATIGAFVKLTSVTPPAANTSTRLREDTESIIIEGDGTRSIAIGEGVQMSSGAQSTDVIVIGANSTHNGSGGFAVILGAGITAGFSGGSVIIGHGANVGAGANNAVVIGYQATMAGGGVAVGYQSNSFNGGVAVGGNANAQQGGAAIGGSVTAGTNCTVVGSNSSTNTAAQDCVLIGNGNAVGATNNVVKLGRSNGTMFFAAGDILLGNSAAGPTGNRTTRAVWGGSTQVSQSGFNIPAPSFTHTHASATGADQSAGDAVWIAPLATGNAASGDFIIQLGAVGASGNTAQTPREVFRVRASDSALEMSDQTDGAGVAAGTIGNAPAAGDPAFWLPVVINGVTRHIPAW